MERITFTVAQPDDLPTVLDILNQGTAYKITRGDYSWSPEGWSEERLAGFMAESTTYFMRCGGALAATYALQLEDEVIWGPQPPTAAYLHRMVVRTGFHGQNFGIKMVNHAIKEAAEAARELLRLDSPEANEKLCGYYQSLGFKAVSTCFVPEYGDYRGVLFERQFA